MRNSESRKFPKFFNPKLTYSSKLMCFKHVPSVPRRAPVCPVVFEVKPTRFLKGPPPAPRITLKPTQRRQFLTYSKTADGFLKPPSIPTRMCITGDASGMCCVSGTLNEYRVPDIMTTDPGTSVFVFFSFKRRIIEARAELYKSM